ncbi:MAG: cbb3-type cytochrome oxidase assembly protein CcoS [Burkholderiaceae bacterium]
MEILGLLIFISLIVIAIVIWLFFNMSSSGQFDDLEAPGRRILMDDDSGVPPEAPKAAHRRPAPPQKDEPR